MHALIASLIVVVAGLLTLWWSTDGLQALTAESARRLAVTRERPFVPAMTLTTMDGTTINLGSRTANVALIEFIYTTCPTICRSAGAELAQVRDRLIANGLANQVKIYSVTFDLKTDGLEELKIYGDTHKADGAVWTVARPNNKQLPELLRTFGVVVIPDEFGGYEHNAAIHIVDRNGRFSQVVDIDDVDGAVEAVRQRLQ